VCADKSLHLFAVSPVVEADHANIDDKDLLQISYLRSLEVSEKPVTMCAMVNNDIVVTCSRETVINMFDLAGDDTPVSTFEGH